MSNNYAARVWNALGGCGAQISERRASCRGRRCRDASDRWLAPDSHSVCRSRWRICSRLSAIILSAGCPSGRPVRGDSPGVRASDPSAHGHAPGPRGTVPCVNQRCRGRVAVDRSWGRRHRNGRWPCLAIGIPRTPPLKIMHGVTIDAPPEAVWPWLAQLGHRASFYSLEFPA